MKLLQTMACVTVILCVRAPAQAQRTFFSANTTINSAVPGSGYIGYASYTDYLSKTNPTSPTVDLASGGSIGTLLYALNSCTLNVSGGSIGGSLFAFNSSAINMSGGSIGVSLNLLDNSTTNVSGGSIGGGLTAFNNSTLNLTGGSIGGSLVARNSSTLNLYGIGLGDTLVDPNANGNSSLYTLTGVLLDGTSVDGKSLYVQNSSLSSFHLFNVTSVPELGSGPLIVGLGIMSAGLLAFNRKRFAA